MNRIRGRNQQLETKMRQNESRFRRLHLLEERLHRRRVIRIVPQRRLKDLDNPFENFDALQFKMRYHMFKETAMYVIKLIEPDLRTPIRRGVQLPPTIQILTVLRYFVTGSFQLVISDMVGITQPTVSNLIRRVSRAIAKHCQTYVKFPNNHEAIAIREGFYNIAGFPGVTGCIDCTHVMILSPGGEDAELYRNRKGVFSINVQAICDHNMNFINLVARWYGSAHDMRIFQNSTISVELEARKAPGMLLGDSGYPCLPYIMTPLLTPKSHSELRYNKSQISTRNIIERTFGVWKRRFPCLMYSRLKLATTLVVIVATGVLHNISRKRNDILDGDVDVEDNVMEYDLQNGEAQGTISGRAKQKEIIQNYFR